MKFTLTSIKNSRIPSVLGVCSTDERLLQWANSAQERLLARGRWWGTTVKAKFCVSNGYLTWPREVAVIEKVNLCCTPISTHGLWYEFGEYINPYCCYGRNDPHLVDIGNSPTTSDIAAGKRVIAYSTHLDDDGKYIIVQGYDTNNAWVRTEVAGAPIDGERIELDTAGTVSSTTWNSITSIIKDETDYDVLLYQYDFATLAVEQQLGRYQPNELYPDYRRSILRNICNGCCTQEDCDNPVYTIDALATLQHVPVSADNDWFVIQNQPALELAMKAVKLEEDGKEMEAELNFKKAIRELQHQLRTMTGDKLHYITTGHGTADPRRVFGNFI